MIKKIFFWLWVMFLLATVSPAPAQQGKMAKIGWLGARSATNATDRQSSGAELFAREFAKLGHVEGKNLTIEYRYAENKLDRLPALAAELVGLKLDVIVAAGGTEQALAAKKATKTIPIVFFNAQSDPVEDGLIDSLARPGGNITGITNFGSVLAGKRLEILKETIPKLTKVAVLWTPQNRGSTPQWKESQVAAKELGLQLHSMEITNADKLDGAFSAAIKAGSTALVVTQIPLLSSDGKRVVALAIKHRLPAIYHRSIYTESGALMSYGTDIAEPFQRASVMVDKILKGTKPADIPVEQPTKFEFVVNLKTAKQIGVTIPPDVLARANRVIR